jgi:hypothetical protein
MIIQNLICETRELEKFEKLFVKLKTGFLLAQE